jgi:hypothetical protein
MSTRRPGQQVRGSTTGVHVAAFAVKADLSGEQVSSLARGGPDDALARAVQVPLERGAPTLATA